MCWYNAEAKNRPSKTGCSAKRQVWASIEKDRDHVRSGLSFGDRVVFVVQGLPHKQECRLNVEKCMLFFGVSFVDVCSLTGPP